LDCFCFIWYRKKSEEYLAFWLRSKEDVEKIDVIRILNVSWKIRNIGMGLVKLKKKGDKKLLYK
jgi:hypothetical protein